MIRNWTRTFGRGAAPAALVCGLFLAAATEVGAQSSTNFRLLPGVAGGPSGSGTSANFRLVGEAGLARSRSSSANFDAIGGLVGGAFSSQATISHSMTANAYRNLAFPLREGSATVTSILSELGGVNNRNWRLGHFSPADNAYQEPGTALDLPDISRGLGYWLVTASNTSVSSTGLPAPLTPFILTLAGGANTYQQIGNPFTFPVAVNLLTVDNGGGVPVLLTAVGNTLTDQVVKDGNGPPYTNATVLNGRTGYFVRKVAAGTVRIIFPFQASAAGSPEPALMKPAGSLWAVGLSPRRDGREGEPIVVGAAPVTGSGWNTFDHGLAPMPPGGDALHLRLPKAGWGEMSGMYVRDFIPPASRMSWEFEVAGADGPGDVALSIHGFDVPSGIGLFLTDPIAGWTREVAPGSAVSVATGSAPRRLVLEAIDGVGGRPGVVQADAFRGAYPNPFREAAGLTFSLVRGGDVAAQIFDLQGRLVRTLARRGLSAGEHVLVWDGRDREGSSLPRGVYLTRWRAGSLSGSGRLVKLD